MAAYYSYIYTDYLFYNVERAKGKPRNLPYGENRWERKELLLFEAIFDSECYWANLVAVWSYSLTLNAIEQISLLFEAFLWL